MLSLIGDVAQGDDGKASLHLHAVLGLQDGTLRGGHFLSGSVQPTLEVTITETVVHLRREKASRSGDCAHQRLSDFDDCYEPPRNRASHSAFSGRHRMAS